MRSRVASSNPFDDKVNSCDLSVRFVDCIFTAIERDCNSDPKGFKTTRRVRVREHNLKIEYTIITAFPGRSFYLGIQLEGVLSTQVA